MEMIAGRFAREATALQKMGVPLSVILGELIKLAAKMAIHDEGKAQAKRSMRGFVDRYFAGITPSDEAKIRGKGPASN